MIYPTSEFIVQCDKCGRLLSIEGFNKFKSKDSALFYTKEYTWKVEEDGTCLCEECIKNGNSGS